MNKRALTAALIVFALAACTSAPSTTPSPAPSATAQPTATLPPLTPGPSSTPSAAPTASLTPTPTPTAPPTAPPTSPPTPTPTSAPTPTPTPTATPTTLPASWPAADRIARGAFSEPAIVVDANRSVHIAATGTGSDNQGIWYLTNATGQWVKQEAVTPWIAQDYEGLGRVDTPAIAIDPSDGSVWIAFTYWECGGECYPNWPNGIFLVNNAAGTWSEPMQVAEDGVGRPSLAVKDGRVYLACWGAGDYNTLHGAVWFTSNASGAWSGRVIAQKGAFPHLVLGADGKVGILFGASDLRYARQKPDGSFAIEHLPDVGGSWVFSMPAIDSTSGNTWAAWSVPRDDQGNYDVYVATRGSSGWSDPVLAIADSPLIGLGVHDGVGQLASTKAGVTYASNASGAFVEQAIDPTVAYWWTSAFAVGPGGRPYFVYARDADTGNPMGIWILKGPGV